jgi:hypothetical protein
VVFRGQAGLDAEGCVRSAELSDHENRNPDWR